MAKLQKSTLKFLKDLEANNNKNWFEIHRKEYEAAKADFVAFNTALIANMEKADPSLSGLDPKKTIFRINRDIRFSKDKSPYKSNMGSTLSKGAKNMSTAGYYFHLQPGNRSFAAAGAYMPDGPLLQAIRQEIDYNFPAFKKMINSAAFKKQFGGLDEFDKLKTLPKGYTSENPAINILRNKSFIVTRNFRDTEVLSPDFLEEVTACFKAAYPLNQFLNNAMKS